MRALERVNNARKFYTMNILLFQKNSKCSYEEALPNQALSNPNHLVTTLDVLNVFIQDKVEVLYLFFAYCEIRHYGMHQKLSVAFTIIL